MFRARRRLALALIGAGGLAGSALAQDGPVRTGAAALGDWRADQPGVRRKITPADQPPPFATPSASARSDVVDRPAGAQLHVLAGFKVGAFASGQDGVRLIRTAPNGDVFMAMQTGGEVRVMRTRDGAGKPLSITTFAGGLDGPFGIAFYPPGPNPQWVYVGDTNAVVRFPYRNGDLKARGPAQTVVAKLTASEGGHVTRDLAFSPDGRTLFVSVGSGSNVAEHMPRKTVTDARRGRRRTRWAPPGATRPTGRTCWRSRPRAARRASTPPASATAWGWRSIRAPTMSGAPPTSATPWATTWCRTT